VVYPTSVVGGALDGTVIFPDGIIVVSKLGVPDMINTPFSPTPVDAFTFSIPVTLRSTIVDLVPAERLLVLTNNEVIAVQGGERGVISPAEVNPLQVSATGASEIVPAVMA